MKSPTSSPEEVLTAKEIVDIATTSPAPGSAQWKRLFASANNAQQTSFRVGGGGQSNTSGWQIVHITNASKRFNEIVGRYSKPTIFNFVKGNFLGPVVISSTAPCILRAVDPVTAPATICTESSNNAAIIIDSPAVELVGLDIVGGSCGAVFVRSSGAVSLKNCALSANHVTHSPGSKSSVPLSSLGNPAVGLRCEGRVHAENCNFTGGTFGALMNSVVQETTTPGNKASAPVRLEGCHFTGQELHHGLIVDGATRIETKGCTFSGLEGDAIVCGGSSVGSIASTTIDGCGGHGIVFEHGSRVWMSGSTIQACQGHGVLAIGGSRPCVQHCTVRGNNAASQVALVGGSSATLRTNAIFVGNTNASATETTTNDLTKSHSGGHHDISSKDDEHAPNKLSSISTSQRTSKESAVGEVHLQVGLSFLHSSDAVVEGNTVSTTVDTLTTSSSGAEGDGPSHRSIAVLVDGTATPHILRNKLVCVVKSNDDANIVDEEDPRNLAAEAEHASSELLGEPPAAFMLGPWQNSKCSDNTIDGYDSLHCYASLVDAGSYDALCGTLGRKLITQSVAAAEEAVAQTNNSPVHTQAAAERKTKNKADLQQAEGVPTAPGLSSGTSTRMSLIWRSQRDTPRVRTGQGSNNSAARGKLAPRPPSSSNSVRHQPRNNNVGQESKDFGDVAETVVETQREQRLRSQAVEAARIATENEVEKAQRRSKEQNEIINLKLEVDRLKARLRTTSKQRDAQHQPNPPPTRPTSARTRRNSSRPTSAKGGRPSSAAGMRRPSSVASTARSNGSGRHTPFERPAQVGKYVWDMEKWKDFCQLRASVHEVRYRADEAEDEEGNHTSTPAEIADRLHDEWLRKQRQKEEDRRMAREQEKQQAPKITPSQLREHVKRIHDDSCEHKQETLKQMAQALRDREARECDSPQRERRMNPEELAEFNDRMFTKHEVFKEELKDKLHKKYVTDLDQRKHVKQSTEQIVRYCASLHTAHKNRKLAESAGESLGTTLFVREARKEELKPKRKKTPPKPRHQVEAYCASLYLSHQDPDVAKIAADAVGDDLVARVASRGSHREMITGTKRIEKR